MSVIEQASVDTQSGWYVLCQAGAECYAIHSQWTSELIRTPEMKIFDLPKKRSGILGLLNHRGHVLPVVELRSLLNLGSFQGEVEAMRSLIQAREQDHIDWLSELEHCASSGAPFTKALDPSKCAFGKWYDSLFENESDLEAVTGGSTILKRICQDFDEPHKRIHAVAEKVLELAKSGDLAAATKRIEEVRNTELSKLKKLFADFLANYSAQRQPSYVAVSCDGVEFALVVDSVDSVVQLDSAEFEPAPELTIVDDSLIRDCVHHNEHLIMILNIPTLIETVSPEVAA